MTTSVAQIWRYPIKAIGAERLGAVELSGHRPIPLDRAWAVLEKGGDTSAGWRSCRNFLRGAKGPSLMAITAKTDGQSITLSHPDCAEFTLQPDDNASVAKFFEWLKPIYPSDRQPPMSLEVSPNEGMADAPFASVSVMNLASLRALSQRAGHDLDVRRFRANIWLEGLAPWEEFDLIGKTLGIGDVILDMAEPITRCRSTEANPVTGQRDIPILKVLQDGWGHTKFGVNARVLQPGLLTEGDGVTVL